MKNNICICIPARYNSTRLENKLLKKFNNDTCIELTYKQCLLSKLANNIYILTDNEIIVNLMSKYTNNIILTEHCNNGTERISRYLNKIPEQYTIIVNIQADEPYINYKNIDHAIEKHINIKDTDNVYYTTLHDETNNYKYIEDVSSVKVTTDNNNNVLLYSRNIIPFNKTGKINKNIKYKIFTGIYIFNREYLKNYHLLHDTFLQKQEDCEQLKILEHGYKIKSYNTIIPNEISLNTEEDYKYLINKYINDDKNLKSHDLFSNIKLVIFDLDGVFTNSKIYISEKNDKFKTYNGKDSYGLKLLNNNNIFTGLITADDTPLVHNMKHIIERMNYISIGNYNKLEVLNKWLNELNLEYINIAYIGDDIPDLDIINKVIFSACPNDAVDIIKNNVSYVCKNKGGDGCVREFIEYILTKIK